MVVLVTCKNEDPIKNEGARVVTRLSIDFSEAQWQLTQSWPPIQLLHCLYQLDLTFCFIILTAKFRNRAMLLDETLIDFFYIDIGFKRILLDRLKWFVVKKNGIFSTSTQILESVYVPGHTI